MNKIEFIDLTAQRRRIEPSLRKRMDRVIDHTKFILGPEVTELESNLAKYVGADECITVANGTDALQIALMAIGIKPGDEVITTPFSFFATVETILILGATPVFVDIDPKTYNIDVNKIEAAITNKTKAIVPVSLYGQCPDFDVINSLASRHGLIVIEDAAQSFGATFKNKKSCSLTDIACTSFFPSKPLGCYGDGGACFTSNKDFAKRIRQIRAHGQDKRYNHPLLGLNSRLDTLQAAVLLSKLEVFDDELLNRQKIANLYSEKLKNHYEVPFINTDCKSAWAQYTLRVSNREDMAKYLEDIGIPTAIHYPIPLHQQKALPESIQNLSFKEAEKASKEVLSLPMHPYLDTDTIERITKAVISFRSKSK